MFELNTNTITLTVNMSKRKWDGADKYILENLYHIKIMKEVVNYNCYLKKSDNDQRCTEK